MPPVVRDLADRLDGLGWVSDLLVAGSLATGDYVPGVSDLDLVALTGGPVGAARQEMLAGLHRELDRGAAHGLDLGCVYVDAGRLGDLGALHPTWTHGGLVQRSLSGVTRAELVRHGFAVLGRPPAAVLPGMTDDDVRRAARAELCGYWAQTVRRPQWWLNPVIAELGLTSIAPELVNRRGDRLPRSIATMSDPPPFATDMITPLPSGEKRGANVIPAKSPSTVWRPDVRSNR